MPVFKAEMPTISHMPAIWPGHFANGYNLPYFCVIQSVGSISTLTVPTEAPRRLYIHPGQYPSAASRTCIGTKVVTNPKEMLVDSHALRCGSVTHGGSRYSRRW
ncbi:hypothetical protein D3C84_1068190 [compost metagenome]